MLRSKRTAATSIDRAVSAEAEPDCGCAPTEAERSAFQREKVSRRLVLAAGALGVVGLGVLASPILPAAYAATYPSWDDVARALQSESAKRAEVIRVQNLITQLQRDVEVKQAAAEVAANEYFAALEAYEAAVDRANDLQAQADEQAALATSTSESAARVAAQLYRDGGDAASMDLFFAGSAASADELLSRLGTMDHLLTRNKEVYAEAVTARNNAQLFSDQAVVARNERDRLQQEANAKMIAAQDAAAAAQAALDAQADHQIELEAQLAALREARSDTVEKYKEGVEVRRKAEEERKRREREEAEKRAQEAAGGGGDPTSSGWARPSGGWVTSWFGIRGTICTPAGCTTGHRGIDFAAGCGSAIYAASSGTVTWAGYDGQFGNRVVISHGGGILSAYAHMQSGSIAVRSGQHVSVGTYLGREGATGLAQGCHLHFEIYSGGVRIDPAPFLRARGVGV